METGSADGASGGSVNSKHSEQKGVEDDVEMSHAEEGEAEQKPLAVSAPLEQPISTQPAEVVDADMP